MLTLYEISEKYGIQLRKLRKMQKDGVLRCEGTGDPIADDIRSFIASGVHPSVRQLVALVEKPALIMELGNRQEEAREIMAALGSPKADPDAPWPDISGSAANDPESIERLASWLKAAIPADRAVSYHWLTVRLMLSVPENLRRHEYPRLNAAFMRVRKNPGFGGWYSNKTYHRPKEFDL